MNQELKGLVYIARGHESKSHMWTGDTLQQYLVFLKDEIKRKRQSLGVSFESKALVLCDAATVHSTGMYDKVRSRFELEANCILIHGGRSSLTDHGVQIVGGWGACGAPKRCMASILALHAESMDETGDRDELQLKVEECIRELWHLH